MWLTHRLVFLVPTCYSVVYECMSFSSLRSSWIFLLSFSSESWILWILVDPQMAVYGLSSSLHSSQNGHANKEDHDKPVRLFGDVTKNSYIYIYICCICHILYIHILKTYGKFQEMCLSMVRSWFSHGFSHLIWSAWDRLLLGGLQHGLGHVLLQLVGGLGGRWKIGTLWGKHGENPFSKKCGEKKTLTLVWAKTWDFLFKMCQEIKHTQK